MKRKIYSALVPFALLVIYSGAYAQKIPQASSAEVNFTSSNLPIIIINTNGKQIIDEEKITVDMGIIDNDISRNYVTDSLNGYNGKIGIEYRGSTSQQFPKKPFGFETRDSLDEDMDASLLGMPENTDWVLYPSYNDKTLMRDVLEYILGAKLGWYTSRTRYCELVLNGDYQGVYVLMEKIKRGKNRVNISKLEEDDISGDKLTGGYIIKLDKESDGDDGWYSKYPQDGYKRKFLYHYPKPENITAEQKTYIQDFMNEFEDVMMSDSFADTAEGYPKYIDVNSFIDYILLTEVCRNVDGYRISCFMYKDRESKGGKLTMGPLWDYNLAFGNCEYDNARYTAGWQLDWDSGKPEDWPMLFWWKKLLSDSSFANRLNARWFELRQTVFKYDNITHDIDSIANLIEEARIRNFERWPILGAYVWPIPYVWANYNEEMYYFRTWINGRLKWMDKNIFGETIAVEEGLQNNIPADHALMQNYPNPFNPSTVISYHLKKAACVTLKVYNMLGAEVSMLVDGTQPAGRHSVKFNAVNTAAGVYFYTLTADGYSETKKMLLLK